MKDSCDKTFVKHLLSSVHRLVETAIGQLFEQFHIEKITERSLWYRQCRFIHQSFAYTVGAFPDYKPAIISTRGVSSSLKVEHRVIICI